MRFRDEYRDPAAAHGFAEAISRSVTRPWTLMEVCGGQTVRPGQEGLSIGVILALVRPGAIRAERTCQVAPPLGPVQAAAGDAVTRWPQRAGLDAEFIREPF